MQVVYLEPLPAELEAFVEQRLPQGCTLRVRRAEEDAAAIVGEAECLIVAVTPVSAELIAAAPRLRLIQHQGVGYNNIDLQAAARAAVPVALAPQGTAEAVAEHAVLLMLSVYRRLLQASGALRQGSWLQWELRAQSYNLQGKRVGIVGLGRIGRGLAQRLAAFGCALYYYDIVRPDPDFETSLGLQFLPFEELLAQSDIVTLHVPLNELTRGMMGAESFGRMQRHAILINTSRGGVVDEAALYAALRGQQIAGAGLDVFQREPLPATSPLLELEQVVATPHIAAGTLDAFAAKIAAAAANIERVRRGERPVDEVLDAYVVAAPASQH